MITNEHIEQFIEQAHRYGDAKLMLCSSGNLSWRIGEEALISGTGSWVPTLGKEKVSICNIASGTPTNGVKPSMESTFHRRFYTISRCSACYIADRDFFLAKGRNPRTCTGN